MKKLTKVGKVLNPLVESADSVEEYGASVWQKLFSSMGDDHLSPPVDYWVAGELLGEIEVGKPLVFYRKIRNGVEVDGIMYTSIVKGFVDMPMEWMRKNNPMGNYTAIETQNSFYILEDYK